MVPSFVGDVDLVLAGEKIRVRTSAGDQLNAERAMGRPVTNAQIELGMRVYYSALRRREPGHPAAKDFRSFVEMLEGADELDAEEVGEGLDPTLRVDSDG